MKFTIVTHNNNGGDTRLQQLIESAQKKDVELNVVDIVSLNELDQVLQQLGDVTWCRFLTLNQRFPGASKFTFLKLASKHTHLFNHKNLEHTFIGHKVYQQAYIKQCTDIPGIDTYQFHTKESVIDAIQNQVLTYPFIQKKSNSSMGKDVYLIHSPEDIVEEEIQKYIFQPFIKNSGDFRVITLKDKAIGGIKRVSQKGHFANNLSLGGTGIAIERSDYEEVFRMAEQIAEVFSLDYAGVDIMYDDEQGMYRFLEVNTMSGWSGFKEITGIPVADHIIDYVKKMG